MNKAVYLVGHGRVDEKIPVIVPPTITMHWLGHLGDVSNGLSYAFLNGGLTTELPSSGPKSSIDQHYLCGERADEDPVTDTKIKNFFDRQTAHPFGCQDPYVLYPRGKTNVSLSSIFTFLEMLSPTVDWHLYWTCCRGYIGQKNPYTSKFDRASGGVVRALRKDPEATPKLSADKHVTVDASFESIRLVAKSDHTVIKEQMWNEQPHGKYDTPSQTKAIEQMLVRV
jgi:hypothetical protein